MKNITHKINNSEYFTTVSELVHFLFFFIMRLKPVFIIFFPQILSKIQEGLKMVQILQDGGRFDACLVEVRSQGPWRLHRGTGKQIISNILICSRHCLHNIWLIIKFFFIFRYSRDWQEQVPSCNQRPPS